MMHRFLMFLTSSDDETRAALEAILLPDISTEVRLQRLLELARAHKLEGVFPPSLESDAITPRDRGELMEWIRKQGIADLLPAEMLQPRWSDPPELRQGERRHPDRRPGRLARSISDGFRLLSAMAAGFAMRPISTNWATLWNALDVEHTDALEELRLDETYLLMAFSFVVAISYPECS